MNETAMGLVDQIRRAADLAGITGDPVEERREDGYVSLDWVMGIHDSGLFQRLYVAAAPSRHGITLMYGVKAMLPLPDGSDVLPALRAKIKNIKQASDFDEVDFAFRLLDAKRWIEVA